MRKVRDIMDVKSDINESYLKVEVYRGNILLVDRYSGEAVKIGEVKQDGK